jgi:hypothetical protein
LITIVSLLDSIVSLDDGLDKAGIPSSSILSSKNSFSVTVGIDILDSGELCKVVDFFLMRGVAFLGEKFDLVGKFVPLLMGRAT